MFNARNQAKLYSLQSSQSAAQSKIAANNAKINRINAAAAESSYRSAASDARRAAQQNQEIAAQNIRKARYNQSASVASARASRGASGFTDEGTGNQRVENTRVALDAQIDNMAQSANIAMNNAWNQAASLEVQGRSAAIQYESAAIQNDADAESYAAQAAAYAAASKSTRNGMVISAIGGLVGAALSADSAAWSNQSLKTNIANAGITGSAADNIYKAYSQNVGLAALNGSSWGSSIGMMFNPYTATMTGNANTRKNNWMSLLAVTNGNIPYNPDLSSNPLISNLY
jgi:hypothetical protein